MVRTRVAVGNPKLCTVKGIPVCVVCPEHVAKFDSVDQLNVITRLGKCELLNGAHNWGKPNAVANESLRQILNKNGGVTVATPPSWSNCKNPSAAGF